MENRSTGQQLSLFAGGALWCDFHAIQVRLLLGVLGHMLIERVPRRAPYATEPTRVLDASRALSPHVDTMHKG